MSQAKGGKLRALAITEAKRSPLAPDWPAMAELLPGYEVTACFALLAPAATPADVVRKVEEAVLKAMEKPALREKLATLGMQAAELAASVPLGRSGQAEEVARVALWLASEEASYVHGAVVDVSGGR